VVGAQEEPTCDITNNNKNDHVLRPSMMDEITASPDSKRALNLEIFTRIAREYDFMTKFLSLGLDASWKRRLVDTVFENYASVVAVDSKEEDWYDDAVLMCVDLACGTGEITHLVATRASRYAHDASKAVYVKGIDLTPEMIEVAKHNYPTYEYPAISFQVGDMNNLAMNGLKDNSVDILTGRYAIRNAPDLRVALREIHRILNLFGFFAFFVASVLEFWVLRSQDLG